MNYRFFVIAAAMKRAILSLLALYPGVVAAAPGNGALVLHSETFVEREVREPEGGVRRVLEKPAEVTPGDTLLFILRYRNGGQQSASNLVVTNPLPAAVAYSAPRRSNAEVSVDGGRNWGSLASLRVRGSDGTVRAARESDVTHVRWRLPEQLAAGGSGKLIFRGIVR